VSGRPSIIAREAGARRIVALQGAATEREGGPFSLQGRHQILRLLGRGERRSGGLVGWRGAVAWRGGAVGCGGAVRRWRGEVARWAAAVPCGGGVARGRGGLRGCGAAVAWQGGVAGRWGGARRWRGEAVGGLLRACWSVGGGGLGRLRIRWRAVRWVSGCQIGIHKRVFGIGCGFLRDWRGFADSGGVSRFFRGLWGGMVR